MGTPQALGLSRGALITWGYARPASGKAQPGAFM